MRVLVCVPVLLHRIMRLPRQTRAESATDSLRVIVSGAASLRPELAADVMDEFGDILFDLYGTTETGWATLATPADLRAAPGTVGRPAHGVAVAVLDGDGSPVPDGQVGGARGQRADLRRVLGGGTKATVRGMMSTGTSDTSTAANGCSSSRRADDMVVSGGETCTPAKSRTFWRAIPPSPTWSCTACPTTSSGNAWLPA